MPENWQPIAKRKQAERASRIPKEWLLRSPIDEKRLHVLDVPRESGILTSEELRLTEQFDATALVSGLRTGLLKSVDVVTAFCKRAAIAQQVTNCLTEIFTNDAIARAKELDDHLARTGKPAGPLHGLPISLKDTFKVKGYDASIGVASFCFKPATTNSALVDLLLSLGAVLYCKTNVPQTMMALDSHNNVFGRTLNPANRLLTAGGSTGGEGALIAMRGSILGIGTDIGGSIRVPSLANGLYGVKPSHGRVPYAGQEGGALPGSSKLGIESTAGPIATSQRDCELLLKAICDATPSTLDPEVFSQTWAQQASLPAHSGGEPKLRVGIVRTDGHVTPLPPIQRLLNEIARTLSSSSASIEVVDVDLSKLGPQCLKTFNGVMSWEGANTWMNHLEKTGEPLSPWLSTRLRRRPQKSLDEVRNIQAQRMDLHTRFLSVWNEKGGHWRSSNSNTSEHKTLDLIICPGAPHPVAAIDRWNSTNYTSMWNLLDLPAAILPIRRFVERDMEGEVPSTPPLNGWDKINREMWTDFDRNVYLGSTLSIQVIAPRLQERRLVEGMGILDEALRGLRDDSGRSKL
jgi:Asp-tRNA(Asn)/Glu-tRNA(Gln) amidotransferase A subunit family amidase